MLCDLQGMKVSMNVL